MTRDSTKTMWRVEYRADHKAKWRMAGVFEVRADARRKCAHYRDQFGFGNTRVIKRVKP